MGLGYKEITKLLSTTFVELKEKENITFCELGNNYLKGPKLMEWLKDNDFDLPIGGEQHPQGVVSKLFWEKVGFIHTSIDMNEYDGALHVDLRTPVPVELVNKFDIVYDGGTGEHVDNQYNLFKNCHDMVKVGGIVVHILPKVGSFPGHCSYYYTVETFNKLGNLNSYNIKELYDHDADGGLMVCAVFEKVLNKPFISEEEFKTVPITYTSYSARDKGLYPYAYK